MASVINDSVWEDSGRWIRRSLRNVAARILEHLQPRSCFASELIVGTIRHLHSAEQAFWMWHHDGGAAVSCGETCGACGRAIRIGWIAFRWFAVVVDVAR